MDDGYIKGGDYMMGIPIQIIYLVLLIIFIVILFVGFRRPIYEVMVASFLFIVIISKSFGSLMEALLYPATSSLFYAIFGFMAVAVIFDGTKVVNGIINLMLSIVGRIRGGAGYVALLGSTFMASLSGTGPGNVAATGVFTIPMMKRSNYPSALAATTEMSASMLGNIIPPAGIILLTYGILDDIYPNTVSMSTWMIIAYGIGFWFFVQRWITLTVLCRLYKVKPVPREELPRFSGSFKKGWPALFLPLFIFIPLLLDAQFTDFIELRLGEDGASAFSGSVLMFTPALAGAYAIVIGRKSLSSGKVKISSVVDILRNSLLQVVPIGVTIYMAYSISQIFISLDMEEAVREWFVSFDLSLITLVIILPLFFMVLGMVLPGSAQVAILGGAMIIVFDMLGGNSVLFAALLPAMTGALEGMTPPLALGLFVAMGIANSKFKDTAKLAIVWIVVHLLMTMILLYNLLPIFGLK